MTERLWEVGNWVRLCWVWCVANKACSAHHMRLSWVLWQQTEERRHFSQYKYNMVLSKKEERRRKGKKTDSCWLKSRVLGNAWLMWLFTACAAVSISSYQIWWGSQKRLYGSKTDLSRVQHTSNYDSIYRVSFSRVSCGFSPLFIYKLWFYLPAACSASI